jgi:caffeoyl-CoA O-methyltransferase
MHKNTDYHGEPEHPERGRQRERRGKHHHAEESEHREHRRGHGERGLHHHEELEILEREEGGHSRGRYHHHASWHIAAEDRPRHGGRRERVERGMLRYLLLDALRHGPKHGYEMIKWLEEQTYGRYAPSPGTVYPTLQLLEDQGLILAQRTDEKSIYQLSESGQKELETHADFTRAFWERNGQPIPPPAMRLETEFVYEDLQDLQRTVEKGVQMTKDQQRLLSLRQALERCKNEIRGLLTGDTVQEQPGPGRPPRGPQLTGRELEEVIARQFAAEDEVLRQTTERAREHGLPSIQISPLQGKLLQVLAKACQARKILEIGALAGYSGIWLARALPADGRLITLEIDETHANVVRESFRQAQVDDRTEVRVGPALETLPQLKEEGPFDLIFIDADKGAYPQYLAEAIRLSRPGSIIVADNCVMGGNALGDVQESTTQPQHFTGPRTYNQRAGSDPALCSIALPMSSGMTVSVVLAKVGDTSEA